MILTIAIGLFQRYFFLWEIPKKADAKKLADNKLYTNAFISIFQIAPNLNNNNYEINQLLQFGAQFDNFL